MPIDTLLAFIIASAALGFAPGPDNIFVLTQSALYGRNSGILVTLGLCTGLIAHTSAVALGVAALFKTSVVAFTMLKIVGASYLVYLAWQAWRHAAASLEVAASNLSSAGALYRRGIIMNITNPKVSIFFLAFLPQFADPANGPVVQQIFMLGAVFIVVALIIFSSIAITAGALGEWLQRTPRARVYLNRIAAVIFALLALRLAIMTI
jgi:threonine/homoserine/homoserine lactone efflux protein